MESKNLEEIIDKALKNMEQFDSLEMGVLIKSIVNLIGRDNAYDLYQKNLYKITNTNEKMLRKRTIANCFEEYLNQKELIKLEDPQIRFLKTCANNPEKIKECYNDNTKKLSKDELADSVIEPINKMIKKHESDYEPRTYERGSQSLIFSI